MLTHDLRSIPQYARKAEAMGYDCLWSSETQHDPYLPLAVAATSTERIKLGTAIAVAFPRSPMITAIHRVGSPEGVGWTDDPRTRLAGEGAQRAPFLGEVRVSGPEASRAGAGDPDHLELLADRRQARLQRRVLPLRPHDTDVQSRADRASEDPNLHLGRKPVHVPRGRGGMRRSARPPVQQPKISPRVCSSLDRRGHAQVRTQTRRFHVRDIDVCRGRRHQRGAGGEQTPGKGADRVLRFDADLPARSLRARLAGHRAPSAP